MNTSERMKILIVEDEEALLNMVSYNLEREGYLPLIATDGNEGLRLARTEAPALILLDIMLPGINGHDLCRILKADASTRHTPIIMLTAKGEEQDRVLGLELGADDYVTKPFGMKELMARVRARLRATRAVPASAASPAHSAEGRVGFGDVTIEKGSCKVLKAGTAVQMSATEYKLLLYLAEHKGKVFSRDQILDALWGNESHVEPRTVDVHIRHLRALIEHDPAHPRYIKTRRGLGYCLVEGEDAE